MRLFPRLLPPLALIAGGLSLALQGIGVAPPHDELSLARGERKTVEVTVFTTEETPLQVFARFIDWTMKPDGTVVEVESQPYSAKPWLKAALDPFEIQKGRYRKIPITVEVPNDPSLNGSYWAAANFVTTPPNQDKNATVLIRVAANYIVYVTIAGTERPGAKITRFDREGDHLVLDVENTGNTYLRLEGSLKFLNPEGKTVGAQKLPERVLLRDGLARLKLKLPKDLPKDAVIAAVEVYAKKPVPLPERLYAEVALR